MNEETLSRRTVLGAGLCGLTASAAFPPLAIAYAANTLNPSSEGTIRRYYAAWEKKDWPTMDHLLTDSFTFSSAAGDDHIVKSVFKTKCWTSQVDFIERFDLQRVYGSGDDAFVLYVCHTKNGKTFRNVEYLQVKGDRVQTVECYFGAQSSFPAAVSKG